MTENAELLRRAVVVLRCDHRHPCQPPHGSLQRPGDCSECGAPFGRDVVSEELEGPLAELLDAMASDMYWLAPYAPHERGHRMWTAALALAEAVQ